MKTQVAPSSQEHEPKQKILGIHKASEGWTYIHILDDTPPPPDLLEQRDRLFAEMLVNYIKKTGSQAS
jgi:hypothetical protein